MKWGLAACNHAHVFLQFEYDNQCLSKPNRVKTMRKVFIALTKLQNAI